MKLQVRLYQGGLAKLGDKESWKSWGGRRGKEGKQIHRRGELMGKEGEGGGRKEKNSQKGETWTRWGKAGERRGNELFTEGEKLRI